MRKSSKPVKQRLHYLSSIVGTGDVGTGDVRTGGGWPDHRPAMSRVTGGHCGERFQATPLNIP